MKNKTSRAKLAVLFCVPLIPLAAVPVAQRVKAHNTAQEQMAARQSQQRKALAARKLVADSTRMLLEEVGSAEHPRLAVVKKVLSQGANPNARHESGDAVLPVATQRQAPTEVVRALLDHGASINARDNTGATALINAAMWGDLRTVHLLLNRGASVKQRMTLAGHRHTALSSVYCMMRGRENDWPSKTAVKSYPAIIKMLKAAGAKE